MYTHIYIYINGDDGKILYKSQLGDFGLLCLIAAAHVGTSPLNGCFFESWIMRQVGVRGYSIAPPSTTNPCEGPNKKRRLDMLDSMVGFPQFIRLYFHTQAKQLSSSLVTTLVPWDFGLLSLTQRCADGARFLGPVPCICGFLQRHRWMRPQHQGWQRWTVAAYVLVYLIWLQTLDEQWRLITSGN